MNQLALPSRYPSGRVLLLLAAAFLLLDPSAHAAGEAAHGSEHGPTADAVVGFIGALIGAGIAAAASLLVYWLTTADQRRRDASERTLRAQTARRLVQAEIAHNLKTLAEYRRETSTDNPVFSVANQSGREWLASHPPPVWSTVAWHRLLDRLLDAVSESQLLAAYTHYSDLASYSLAVEKFMIYQVEQKPEELKSTAHFVQETIASRIEQAGNPLGAAASVTSTG